MRKRLPPVLSGLGFLLCLLSARSLAEDKTPPLSESVSFEQIPDLLEKPDAKVKAGIDGLIAAVDAEVKANRLPPALSEKLRSVANRAGFPSNIDGKEFFAAVGLPLDNDAVAKAATVLNEAFMTARHDCAADYQFLRDAIPARVGELTRHAKTPEEVDSVLTVVVRIGEWFESHHGAVGAPLKVNGAFGPFYPKGCETFLRCFSEILADSREKPANIPENDVAGFLNSRILASEFVSDADIRVRFLLMNAPLKDALEASRNSLTKALLERKSSADVSNALLAYEDAYRHYKRMDFAGVHSASTDDGVGREDVNAYKTLASLARNVEARQWREAWQLLGTARTTAQYLNSKRWLEFQQLIEKWDQEVKDGLAPEALQTEELEADARRFYEGLRAKLAEAKTPEDLQSLAAVLPQAKDEGRVVRLTFSHRFSDVISELLAMWRSRDSREILERAMRATAAQGAEFAADVERIRDRIALESLARTLGAPELSKPPLAQQSLDAALDHLCSDLAARGEWKRLIQILETRDAAAAEAGFIPKGADAIASVRSFLAGRNFELAEQWTDAAARYKIVLRNAVENTPIRDATLRLKALAKEHPKEVEAAQAPALERAPTADR